MAEPIKPVAPVTKTRIFISFFDLTKIRYKRGSAVSKSAFVVIKSAVKVVRKSITTKLNAIAGYVKYCCWKA
jgi:hypothetical protein